MELLARHAQQGKLKKEDCTIHVRNIDEKLTEDNLIQFLAFLGNIVDYKKVEELVDGTKSYYYCVQFSNLQETKKALGVDGTQIISKKIVVTTPGRLAKNTESKKVEEKKTASIKEANVKKEEKNENKKDTKVVKQEHPKRELSEREKNMRRTVYLGNVNSQITQPQLVDFFSCCGPISYVRLAGDGKQPTRFAFVEFFDEEGAKRALEMNGSTLANRPVKVNKSNNQIVKSHVRLSNNEFRMLQRRVQALRKKVARKAQNEGIEVVNDMDEVDLMLEDQDEAQHRSRKRGRGRTEFFVEDRPRKRRKYDRDYDRSNYQDDRRRQSPRDRPRRDDYPQRREYDRRDSDRSFDRSYDQNRYDRSGDRFYDRPYERQ